MTLYCVKQDGSDVFLYDAGDRIACHGCKFQAVDENDVPIPPIKQTEFGSRAEALSHLDEHRQKGHLVPDRAMQLLREEIKNFGYEVG